jgi:hypothetical protein
MRQNETLFGVIPGGVRGRMRGWPRARATGPEGTPGSKAPPPVAASAATGLPAGRREGEGPSIARSSVLSGSQLSADLAAGRERSQDGEEQHDRRSQRSERAHAMLSRP